MVPAEVLFECRLNYIIIPFNDGINSSVYEMQKTQKCAIVAFAVMYLPVRVALLIMAHNVLPRLVADANYIIALGEDDLLQWSPLRRRSRKK